ncbi:MAG TPA: GNAT family N-acetyltransferase [Myxococcus sp.]|nr:GNAT family N-acetyltransferase [Myxococcus sp.]
MTDAELTVRLHANVLAFKRLQTARGLLRHLGLPGVDAFCMPARPEVLYFQQVYFTDAGALSQALPAVEDFFHGHGARAWRVFMLPGDLEAGRVLGGAGYRPEERSAAMGALLDELPRASPLVPLEAPETLETLVEVNAAVWPEWADVQRIWLGPPRVPVHALVAREGGRPLACGFALDVGDTTGVYMVATAPGARSRGLASELMHGVHAAARARGLTACVLQSTPAGYNLYRRLGYRDLGSWTVWGPR